MMQRWHIVFVSLAIALWSYGEVEAFSNLKPTPSFHKQTMGFCSSPKVSCNTSKMPKDDNIVYEKLSGTISWLKTNKKSLTTAAGIATSAALYAIPSVSHAATVPVTQIASGGVTLASANAIIEKLSETGFYQAFSLVFLSEIGDKTFFIAGLLAMKTSRFISFVGSMSALVVMTIISCAIGQIFHAVPSGLTQGLPLDDIAAVAAFAFFGIKTLKEALEMDSEGGGTMEEEFEEAEEAVEERKSIVDESFLAKIISIFVLVFAAEFGDRSFLSTIALSAAQNPVSVAGGAIAAHGAATGIAVLGGGVIAKYISEKVIGIIGGSLFLVFAVTTAMGLF